MVEVKVTRVDSVNKFVESYEFLDFVSARKAANSFNKSAIDTTADVIRKDIDDIDIPLIEFKDSSLIINGEAISDEVFEKNFVGYINENRAELLENIKTWRCEASDTDKMLMDEDIEYLSVLCDKYIFSSINTNEYVSATAEPLKFRDICLDILEVNRKLKSQKAKNK